MQEVLYCSLKIIIQDFQSVFYLKSFKVFLEALHRQFRHNGTSSYPLKSYAFNGKVDDVVNVQQRVFNVKGLDGQPFLRPIVRGKAGVLLL